MRVVKHNFLAALMILVATVVSATVNAVTFHPRMDEAQWITRSTVFQCRMVQPIPFFGRAVFDQSAGQPPRFYLQSLANPMEKGQASLKSHAPRWKPEMPTTDLGRVMVESGEMPVELGAVMATQLLAELFEGKSPEFTRRAWYTAAANRAIDSEQGVSSPAGQVATDDTAIRVALSSVNFRAAYSRYRQCLAELLPIGFDELERSRILFASDEYELIPEARERLDLVARYAVSDTDLDQIYIDGHTDNTHTRPYNAELSRKRAEAVSSYLVTRGVSANLIRLRYHGERFPITTNETLEGRAKNRRVTIRLDRILPAFSPR